MKKNCVLLISCLVFLAHSSYATWTWRNPSPTGNDLQAITFCSQYGIFAAVDRAGCIYTSSSGLNWQEPYIGNGATPLTGITSGDFTIVAVGGDGSGNGIVYTSKDGGVTWSNTLSGNSGISFLNAVAFGKDGSGNSEFVAVGVGGAAASSLDGVNWISEGTPLAPNSMNGIAYGADPGAFVAVGGGGAIYYSTDGATWQVSTSGTTFQLNAVAYGLGTPGFQMESGYFVAVGDGVFLTTFISSDVMGFGVSDSEDSGTGVTCDGPDNKFLTVDNEATEATFVSTNNGANWFDANTKVYPTNTPTFYPPTMTAVAYGNNAFVGVGRSGLTSISSDASNWTQNVSGPLLNLTCGVYGQNLFVAGGGMIDGLAGIYTSPDGAHWTQDQDPTAITAFNGTTPSGFIYDSHQFVGVGTDNGAGGITAPAVGVALLSADGIHWASNNITSSGHTPPLTGIALGTGIGQTTYVAVGDEGSIFYSTNRGATWVSHPLSATFAPNLNGVTFGNSKFVAVGASGLSAVSPNGQTWSTNNYSKLNTNLNAVAFGKGLYVAVGGQNNNYGVIFTSPDGLDWTQQYKYSTGPTYPALNSVTYAGGAFIAVGGGGKIFISRDGVFWLPATSGTLNTLNCALFGAGQYLLLGAGGAILGSSVLLLPESHEVNLTHSSGSGTSFDISGTAGQSVIIETSTDLKNWSILDTAPIPQGGAFTFTDSDTTSQVKYYRVPYFP